jgi:hypothetical protein
MYSKIGFFKAEIAVSFEGFIRQRTVQYPASGYTPVA